MPVAVEVEAPRVTAAFAKQLESAADGMVTPDTLLELNAANVGGHGAALTAVEPAIGTPCEGIRHGMSVLDAEPAQQHFGIGVRDVVVVTVWVKQQVRRIEDEYPAVAKREP